ncbi:MAG TPA: glycosyl hydrolase family 28 protein [Planctomycetota bacterium]|nr:glycosyl hydrolase family 28 protein [Planctomycetota bacterium]
MTNVQVRPLWLPPALLVAALAVALAANAGEKPPMPDAPPEGLVVCPAPPEEKLSEDFELTVGGRKVPVYSCRVSAMPFNQVWPGYQRPLDQTELASFAYWDMATPAAVEIISKRQVQSVIVRPLSRGIQPKVEGNRVSLRLPGPGHLVVEVNGWHQALHLFVSPPEKDPPRPTDPGVLYFGPGVHRPGKIHMESNQTLYVAGGAVVYGAVEATGASNLKVLGRGILDASGFERGKGGGNLRFSDCSGVVVDGPVLRDPDVWCLSAFGCRDVAIANVKLIGLWRYNADGIDICNSQDVTIRDCFVRSFDDSLVLKGLKGSKRSFDDRPVRNVLGTGCVIWNDWGRAIEIGAETCAPEIDHVIFRDCDIIRTVHIAIDIQHGDRAAVHDITFENIRVELDEFNPQPRMQGGRDARYTLNPQDRYCPHLLVIVIRPTPYSKDTQRGTVRNVVFKDISVAGKPVPASDFRGFDPDHGVDGITIENLRFNGRPIGDARAARLTIGPHVKDVRFVAPPPR